MYLILTRNGVKVMFNFFKKKPHKTKVYNAYVTKYGLFITSNEYDYPIATFDDILTLEVAKKDNFYDLYQYRKEFIDRFFKHVEDNLDKIGSYLHISKETWKLAIDCYKETGDYREYINSSDLWDTLYDYYGVDDVLLFRRALCHNFSKF